MLSGAVCMLVALDATYKALSKNIACSLHLGASLSR
jgi:hypothetical protein